MKLFVIKDSQDNFQVIGAQGFIPQGVIADAPIGAEISDGRFINVVDGLAILDTALKEQTLEQERLAAESEKSAKQTRIQTLRQQLDEYRDFDIANATAAQLREQDARERRIVLKIVRVIRQIIEDGE